jgi:cysteine synthase B
MMGAYLGYPVTLYMSANASFERKKMIQNFGANIVETDPMESSDGAFNAVQAVVRQNPKKWFYPDQYNNYANRRAHYNTPAEEIWTQCAGELTHFVSVTGTSGTFMGNTCRLKELKPALKAFAVQPDSPIHGIEGTKHLASTIIPGIFDKSVADGFIGVSTDEAYDMARLLAKQDGLFVGVSAGANVKAALKLSEKLPPNSVIVTILCDSGARYLSDGFWEATQ